jgi:hypothetical protein
MAYKLNSGVVFTMDGVRLLISILTQGALHKNAYKSEPDKKRVKSLIEAKRQHCYNIIDELEAEYNRQKKRPEGGTSSDTGGSATFNDGSFQEDANAARERSRKRKAMDQHDTTDTTPPPTATLCKADATYCSFLVDSSQGIAKASYNEAKPEGWASLEELTCFALRELVECQAVEARLDHDPRAFDKDRPCFTWAPKCNGGNDAMVPYSKRSKMETEHSITMESLWKQLPCLHDTADDFNGDSGDDGCGGGSSKTFEAFKKYEMQLLGFGADRDCAIIVKGQFIDAAAVVAAASKTPMCRMSAAKLIDQTAFDKEKFVYQVVNFCERHLPLRFLTFSDAVALLAAMSDGVLDLLASRMVSDAILGRSAGDMTSCINIAPRSKIYNVLASDKLLQLRKAIQASPHDIGIISFVYATINPAFKGKVKIGETFDVTRRVCNLNTGCCYPDWHTAVAVAPTFNSKRDEKKVHRRLASYKCGGSREFFETAVSTAVVFLKEEVEGPFWAEFARRTQGR